MCSDTARFKMPAAEWPLDVDRVRDLLREQHPALATLPLRRVEHGWDNAMFRLGDALAVRLPRRRMAIEGVRAEQTWLPRLAKRLPVALPLPARIGVAGPSFPWPWSIVQWVPGTPADLEPPSADQAWVVADILRELHVPAAADAPVNSVRGQPLTMREDAVASCIDRLARIPTGLGSDTWSRLRAIWRRAVSAPPAARCSLIHGDLHPRNILVDDGNVCGVIDWGDLCAGDPAIDLASAWMLFDDASARAALFGRYCCESALKQRAEGWGVFFGSILLEAGLAGDTRFTAVGRATLGRLVVDAVESDAVPPSRESSIRHA